jgi:hypothetical protein
MKDIISTWAEIRPRTKEEWKFFLMLAFVAAILGAGGYCAIYLGNLLG